MNHFYLPIWDSRWSYCAAVGFVCLNERPQCVPISCSTQDQVDKCYQEDERDCPACRTVNSSARICRGQRTLNGSRTMD